MRSESLMKKISILLALVMIMSLMSACSSSGTNTTATAGTAVSTASASSADTSSAAETTAATAPSYDKHVTFTTSTIETGSATSYSDDAVYRYFADMFNIDYEVSPVTWDNWEEKTRIWINGGTMPDVTFWNFKNYGDYNYDEYVSYVKQGLISPLPDGWETKYPNLYKMVQATGIYDKLLIDGKAYAIPKVIFWLFAPVDKFLSHGAVYYRKDWLEKLGMEDFGPLVTEGQLKEYCQKAIEADLAGNGHTIGLAGQPSKIVGQITTLENSAWNTFVKQDGKYLWGPTLPGTVKGIEKTKAWYDEGIIDPDFYLDKTTEPKNKFASGLAAALMEDGPMTHYVYRCTEFTAANPGLDPLDCIGSTSLVTNDGRWTGQQLPNYWAASLFSPDIDPETLDRVLALMDYTCTKEAQEVIALGIKDVDWTYNSDGSYKILREANEDGTYPDIKAKYNSINYWYIFSVLADDFSFADPTIDPRISNRVKAVYAAREEKGDYLPLDYDYAFFTSDAKSKYSVDIESEVARIVVDKSADVETEWAKFIENNRALWEPVVNDLNAAFAG